ncbi:MAG: hypothetical protein GF344_08405, partial [Chitinivibrionales bacterium]|nr:hypothetical protein [Chitinivibrionales bacterium]MBD3356898.1 hypothetical protein [Chitinivibrionales bacterium]
MNRLGGNRNRQNLRNSTKTSTKQTSAQFIRRCLVSRQIKSETKIPFHFGPLPIALSFLLIGLQGCNLDNPNDAEYNFWTFSGYVIDGNDGEPLVDATIHYRTDDDRHETATTGNAGDFHIENLPFGEADFRFTYQCPDTPKTRYTEKRIIKSSWKEGSPGEGKLANISDIIKLFPLSATLTGNVVVRLSQSEQTV